MKTAIKVIIAIVAALAIVALVMAATRMDATTNFFAAGRKWIEEISSFSGIYGNNRAAVEEYIEPTENIETKDEAVTNPATVPETEPITVDFLNPLTAVDENGDVEVEGVYSIENDNSGSGNQSPGTGTIISDDNGEALFQKESRTYEGLPTTYDEYLDMSLNDRIALADMMGEDFDPWVEDLKAHRDDDKIIISATDQIETLE